MPFQSWCIYECFPTYAAHEWPLTSVKHFMHSQIVLLDEFLVTVVAIEWLLSNALTGYPSGQISYLSGGCWKVFQQCEAFHALSGCPSGWISYNSWFVISRAFIKWLHLSTWLNFSDWMIDLNSNKWMHASEQQIVIIKGKQQNLIEIPDFLSTTEGCPLLRAFTK